MAEGQVRENVRLTPDARVGQQPPPTAFSGFWKVPLNAFGVSLGDRRKGPVHIANRQITLLPALPHPAILGGVRQKQGQRQPCQT